MMDRLYDSVNITEVRNTVREVHVILSDLCTYSGLPDDISRSLFVVNELIANIHHAEWHIRTF